MKLDRNVNPTGRGKYALINLRTNKVEWGTTEADEFFVIKLKDKYARDALEAYAWAARQDGEEEWFDEVIGLARRSGEFHPLCKKPD